MAKGLFFDLSEEKKSRIIEAGLNEFAQYGFSESSTNRIVKKAEISKGSLFKYFDNKENFYFHILDYIIADMTQELKQDAVALSHDLFERIIQYSGLEFDWYSKNPEKYKLIKRALNDDNSEIYRKTVERYQLQGKSFYYKLFENVNFDEFRWGKDRILNVLRWFLMGFNEEYINELKLDDNINQVKEHYINCLKEYIEILQKGLYK